jgi:hypothetical protein
MEDSMTDATCEAEFEHRLPAAYSQGFAHVRVVTLSNADDVGPLAVPERLAVPETVSPVLADLKGPFAIADEKAPL